MRLILCFTEFKQFLNASLKGFYIFDNSTHAPHFEEPERFREILEKDVLQKNFNLADK